MSEETQTAVRRAVDYSNIEDKINFDSDRDEVNNQNMARLGNVEKVRTPIFSSFDRARTVQRVRRGGSPNFF